MNRDDVWRGIDEQRRRLVGLLEDLSAQEWEHPSLCEDWTVRQVAAHVALQNFGLADLPRGILEMLRRGGVNGAISALARRHAELPPDQIIAEIRDRIGVWQPLPTVTYLDSAVDYLVHPQDIAIPLGRQLPMAPDLAAVAADRVWSSPRMFHARSTFRGYRFVATDTEWTVGSGRDVAGPVEALLLLLTGRFAGLSRLTGPGVDALQSKRPVRG